MTGACDGVRGMEADAGGGALVGTQAAEHGNQAKEFAVSSEALGRNRKILSEVYIVIVCVCVCVCSCPVVSDSLQPHGL